MQKYSIFSDFEKQKKLAEVATEKQRLNKPLYWILKQMVIPKSTYYDWLGNGGKSKSRAPKTIWNKTPEEIKKRIFELRDNASLYRSQRSPAGIVAELEKENLFFSPSGIWGILDRAGKGREFKTDRDTYLIYPRAERFFQVVCIDDFSLSNEKTGDLTVFNALDEYSQESLAANFSAHRINQRDVIALLEGIKKEYGRLPKILRLDNARAHKSRLVKKYCEKNNIALQFIDKGKPQQNWPVEAFNGVIQRDIVGGGLFNWDEPDKNQKTIDEYRKYYNTQKPLLSDPLRRTPREISSGTTSARTQARLKIKLLRKHRGQKTAREYLLKIFKQPLFCQQKLSEMCIN